MGFKSLKDMKKSSNVMTQKLAEKIDSQNSSNFTPDERFWTIKKNKESGNGYAVIRFLPARPGAEEDECYTRLYSHGFEGRAGWYIENCPTTIGKNCPLCEANTRLWQSGDEGSKKIASVRKRKLSYIANIYVVEDRDNPENEGKVFLFRFGKKIFEKLEEAMHPEDEDEEAFNPFDFWGGANFKIKLRTVGGFNNYDTSRFAAPSEFLDGDEEELDAVWQAEHDLEWSLFVFIVNNLF